MTTLRMTEVTAAELEEMAFNSGRHIEIDNTLNVAFLRIDAVTYVARLWGPPMPRPVGDETAVAS